MAGTISSVLLTPVLAALPEAAHEAFLRATDTSEALIRDAEHRVSAAQFCVAWSELARWTDNPAIALRIAEQTPVGAFGVVEYLCRSRATLGDGLRQWVRFLNILDDAVVVGMVDHGDDTAIRVLVESEAPAPASHELCFAILARRAGSVSANPVAPIAVEFAHRCRVDPSIYSQWFGAPVHFGCEHTQLILSRDSLGSALITADAGLTEVFSKLVSERELQLSEATDALNTSFVNTVRRELQYSLREAAASPEQVARRLGLTPRALQRRLKSEGTTDLDTWRAYQSFFPEAMRSTTEATTPDEERWACRGLDVHIDRLGDADAKLKVVVLLGAGAYGRVMAPCRSSRRTTVMRPSRPTCRAAA